MANTQMDQTFSMDRKLNIEGVIYQEKKMLTDFREEDGKKMCTFSHSRSIGNRTWTAQKKIVDGVFENENLTFTTNDINDDIAHFNEDWEENWHPMNDELFIGRGMFDELLGEFFGIWIEL